MKTKLILPLVAVAAVAVYLMTKGAAPWWASLDLSPEQRSMLEDQERDFWPAAQGNTGYPAAALTDTTAPKVWV